MTMQPSLRDAVHKPVQIAGLKTRHWSLCIFHAVLRKAGRVAAH